MWHFQGGKAQVTPGVAVAEELEEKQQEQQQASHDKLLPLEAADVLEDVVYLDVYPIGGRCGIADQILNLHSPNHPQLCKP